MALIRTAASVLAALLACHALAAAEVVVAAYNVQNYLRMARTVDGRHVRDAPKPEAEISALVRILTQIRPDILGLVEMGDRATLEDLQARLKAAGLDLPHSEWVEGADAERHVCLLSRFPIVARQSRSDVSFTLNNVTERMNRGILDVTVEVSPDYRLRLVGVHLKSRRPVPEYDEAWMRAKEAWFLRDHLNAILAADPQANLLVFGDFNDTKNEYPVREVIGRKGSPTHMTDLWLRDSRGERWTHYWKVADVYSRIDYFLVSPGLLPEMVAEKSGIDDSPDWNVASDHRAIYTTIVPRDQ